MHRSTLSANALGEIRSGTCAAVTMLAANAVGTIVTAACGVIIPTATPLPPITSHRSIYAVVTVGSRHDCGYDGGGMHYIMSVAAPRAGDPRTVHYQGGALELDVGDELLAEIGSTPMPGPGPGALRCIKRLPRTDGEVWRLTDARLATGRWRAQLANGAWPADRLHTIAWWEAAPVRFTAVVRSQRRGNRVVFVAAGAGETKIHFVAGRLHTSAFGWQRPFRDEVDADEIEADEVEDDELVPDGQRYMVGALAWEDDPPARGSPATPGWIVVSRRPM